MSDFNRLNALYADDLQLQREQVVRRSLRGGEPPRRTTRRALATRLHRIADRLDGS
jgi:hypothetical protein